MAIKKILVVDDSLSVRQMVRTTLEEGGYETTEARDGEEAIERFRSSPADLVITDLTMPRVDGIELIKELRQEPGCRFLPIIMLTTESNEEKKQEGKKAGVSGWLVKPFKAEQILAVVKMVIS